MVNLINKFFAAATVFTLAAVSQAGLLNVNNISRNQIVNISYNGNSETVYAGGFSTTYAGDGRSYLSFCADLDHNQYVPGVSDVTAGTKINVANGQLLSNLLTKFADAVDSYPYEEAAALQLAVWDIWADGGDGLTKGKFRASGNYRPTETLATYMIKRAKQYTGPADLVVYNVNRVPGENTQGQNLIRAVPEPTGIAVAGLGLVALLRRRKTSASIS